MKIGSLFTGYGGLDTAVEKWFDARTVWTSDIDPGACKIIAHRMPHAPNLGDITKIDWATVEPVDILTGGYPCQPFSHAGQRQGTNDERHLWPYVVEALSYLRPKIGVFENVRGHLSLGFDQVLRDLSILGYETRWVVLRAADVGAPHGRARIFIIAIDRQLRGWPDRRGGVHRNPGIGWVLPTSPEGVHDGQGLASAPTDASDLRRVTEPGTASTGGNQGDAHLASNRPACGSCDRGCASCSVGQARVGRDRASVSSHDRLGSEAEQPTSHLGRVDAHKGAGVRDPHPAREQGRTRLAGTAAALTSSDGDPQFGYMVGAGGRLVWPGGVRGQIPHKWPDDRGQDLRAADVGAPHGRFRVFVVATARHAGHDAGGAEQRQQPRSVSQASRSGQSSSGPVADAERCGRYGWAGELGSGRREQAADRGDAAADASGQRHGRGQNRRSVGRVDGTPEGEARQRERARGVAGNRGATTTADAASDGRDEGRTEPARLVGGSHAAVSGNAAADTAGTEWRGPEPEDLPPATRPAAELGERPGPVAWGAYEPAIRRWEAVLGRPAPAPTDTGPKGGQRLSPRFVEWLMGLPPGWVTDVPDLSRNAQLKALGNGVVPQQAYEALRRASATEAAV